MKKILGSICVLFYSVISFAQNAPHSWKEHFAYGSVKQIIHVENSIIALTSNGLFFYNTNTSEIIKLTKIQGLSTIGLSTMAYHSLKSELIVGYTNGCIDIIELPNLKITNIPTIAQRSIYGSKAIRDICFQNDTAFVATDFGIISMNMQTHDFIHTTILGNEGESISVSDIDIDSTTHTLYAATQKGIYFINTNKNLSDVSLWASISNIPHSQENISCIAFYNQALYYAIKKTEPEHDSIYKISNNIATPFSTQIDNIERITNKNNSLLITGTQTIKIFDKNEILTHTIDTSDADNSVSFKDALIFPDNSIWIADGLSGIFNTLSYSPVYPKGPYSNLTSEVMYNNNKLYVVSGNSSSYQIGMVNIFDGATWYGHWNWAVRNTSSIYPVSNSEKYFYGTAGWGLVESSKAWGYDTIYNKSNSPIQNIYEGDSRYEQIPDITMDSKKNLWFLNKGVTNSLHVKTNDNHWYSYSLFGQDKIKWVERIIIDKNGYKWIAGDTKLVVFSENGTFDTTSDDLYTYIALSDDEGNIADRTTCIAEDIDGSIWVGTTQGIAVHSMASRVFKDQKTIKRIKIEIDGEIGYLLSSEKITAITVDGANRKWIGTQNSGVFLISADGTKQLQNFTVSNSPLPANSITAITINQKTGEVFIGTESGLVSYISDATWGSQSMEDVYVFPNPVRENYFDNIYIKGTVTNAIIKITDISGNLVFQTIANGGVGVWNGKNLNGERVATGVYLIYISDEEGKETRVTKLLFIK